MRFSAGFIAIVWGFGCLHPATIAADTPYPATAPQNLAYRQNPVYIGLHQSIKADQPIITGGSPQNYSVTPKLPVGLRIDRHTGVLSGASQVTAPLANYRVHAANAGGSVDSIVALGVFANAPPQLNPKQTFIGNSFPGSNKTSERVSNFVPDDLEAIAVQPDGTLYTNSLYDEGGNTAAIFARQAIRLHFQDLHGWNRDGGQAIATDGRYVFVALTQHSGFNRPGFPRSTCGAFYAVRRYTLDGKPAPRTHQQNGDLPDTDGWDGSFLTVSADVQYPGFQNPDPLQCTKVIAQGGALQEAGAPVMGLAAGQGHLYVSDYRRHSVRVYNVDTLEEERNRRILLEPFGTSPERPWQLALNPKSHIMWVVQRDAQKARIVPYRLQENGAQPLFSQAIDELVDPTALAFDPSGRYLLVADDGPQTQQIVIYDCRREKARPVRINTLGVAGGAFGAASIERGLAAPLVFDHPVGVGIDATGKIYVATNGHGLQRSFSSEVPVLAPTTQHYFSIKEFTPTITGIRDAHPRLTFEYHNWVFVDNFTFLGNDVYTKFQEFTITPGKTATGEFPLRRVGSTLDAIRYPTDPRITNQRAGIWAQSIGGHPFLFMSSQMASTGLAVYRMHNHTAIPTAYVSIGNTPSRQSDGTVRSGEWTWNDQRGDGNIAADSIVENPMAKFYSHVWAWNTDELGDIFAVSEWPDRMYHHFRVFRFNLQSIDRNGVPRYPDIAHAQEDISLPEGLFHRIERFLYVQKTDTAYISGYSAADESYDRDWGMVGTQLARFDHWSKPSQRTLVWKTVLPYQLSLPRVFDWQNAPSTSPRTLSLAGGRLYVVYNTPAWIQVIDAQTGHFTSQPIFAQTQFGGKKMLVDAPYTANATLRTNGQTYLSVEDDARGKNMLYIFDP